jgi:hypothetical protein
MRWCTAALLLVFHVRHCATAADIPDLVKQIKSADADTAQAWQELSRLPATEIPRLLAAIDDASPAAANWLRSAVDAIAERDRAALPAAALASFLQDKRHAGRGRRLAYELLCIADPTTPARLLPTMLDDPSAELRYDAVEAAFAAVKPQPKELTTAKTELRKLLSAARDGQQVDAIARELEQRGEPVDLVAHFGFITRWQIAGPFDNTGGRGYRDVFPPERGVDLAAKYVGKGGAEVIWKPNDAGDNTGSISLNRVFPGPAVGQNGKLSGMKAAVAFAFAEVDAPAERDAVIRLASATAFKVFVNGREVLSRETYHQSFDRDAFSAPVHLVKGRNTILMKVCQNDQTEPWAQNWMFQLRLTDSLGAVLPLVVVTSGTGK